MRSKFILAIFIILFSIPTAYGFDGIGTIGGRSAGMGRASVSLTDFWAIQNNPAGMALQQNISAGLAYENRYFMKELGLKSAAVIVPAEFGVLGVSYNQFGYDLYNENKIGLAYARSFGPAFRIGLQLDYLNTNFAEGYEAMNNVTFELGVQSNVTPQLIVGAYVFNPIRVTLSDYTDERIPVVLRFGMTYLFTEKFLGIVEFEKNSNFDPDVRFGMEYILNQNFYLRTGVAVNPGLFTFGAGMNFSNLRFDIAASLHQVLGASAQIGIIYEFGKKAE